MRGARFGRWSGAPFARANFDPGEPRVPAGSPDGGQWTGGEGDGSAGGGDGAAAGSSRDGGALGSGAGESETPATDSGRAWERLSPEDLRVEARLRTFAGAPYE